MNLDRALRSPSCRAEVTAPEQPLPAHTAGRTRGAQGPPPALASGRRALRGPPAHPRPSRIYSSSSCPGHRESRAPPWGSCRLPPRFQTGGQRSARDTGPPLLSLRSPRRARGRPGRPGQSAHRPLVLFLEATTPARLQPRLRGGPGSGPGGVGTADQVGSRNPRTCAKHQGPLALPLLLRGPRVTKGTLSQRPKERRRLGVAAKPRRDGEASSRRRSLVATAKPGVESEPPATRALCCHCFRPQRPTSGRRPSPRLPRRSFQTPAGQSPGTDPTPRRHLPPPGVLDHRGPVPSEHGRPGVCELAAGTQPRGVPGPSSRAGVTAATLSLGTVVRPPVMPERARRTRRACCASWAHGPVTVPMGAAGGEWW